MTCKIKFKDGTVHDCKPVSNKPAIQETLEKFDGLCNSLSIAEFLDAEFATKLKTFISKELTLAEQNGFKQGYVEGRIDSEIS